MSKNIEKHQLKQIMSGGKTPKHINYGSIHKYTPYCIKCVEERNEFYMVLCTVNLIT